MMMIIKCNRFIAFTSHIDMTVIPYTKHMRKNTQTHIRILRTVIHSNRFAKNEWISVLR